MHRPVATLALALAAFGCSKAPAPAAAPAEPAPAPVVPGAAPTPAVADPASPAAAASPTAPPADASPTGVPVGSVAPDFTLPDLDGKRVSLADFRGKVTVLEWYNPDCPFVKHAHTLGTLKDASARWSARQVAWLSINSSAEGKEGAGVDRNRASMQEYGFQNPVLLDGDGQVGHRYGATRTPEVVLIDATGHVAYRGAPYLMPDGGDALRPDTPRYLDEALEAVLTGKPVAQAQTKPMGCSVKYAK